MFEIKVSKEIKDTCPVFAGAAVYAAVKNTAYSEGLWQEINAFTEQLTSTTQMEDIKRQPVIFATREVPLYDMSNFRIVYQRRCRDERN